MRGSSPPEGSQDATCSSASFGTWWNKDLGCSNVGTASAGRYLGRLKTEIEFHLLAMAFNLKKAVGLLVV